MNWSDYEAAWRRQEPPVGRDADLPTLRATFETRSRKLHGAMLVRDLSEAGAGLVVVGAYAYFWRQLGAAGWPMAFAIALVLGVSGFFVRERLRARRLRLGADAPLLAKVEADIAELRHQRRLLRTVWAWYLAPCAGAIAIQVAVILHRLPSWDPLREPAIFLGFFGFFALVFWFAWHINRRALRKRIQPRLDELEKLLKDLLAES
jgi:hypothetical protein